MTRMETTTVTPQEKGGSLGEGSYAAPGAPLGGVLTKYKPELGRATRVGTFAALLALIAWGWIFLRDRLSVYQGDETWRLLITEGLPIVVFVALAAGAWWVTMVNHKSSDFMIATEGEMKKVNWSTRREVIGSTKVVILFTFLLALYLFAVDVAFQALFTVIGVLKK